jgi:hypothetical protein
MNAKTRAKAKAAYGHASDLYKLLGELARELSSAEDFAGYFLVTDVKDSVFGRKSTEDVLGKLGAVSRMGEKEA